MDRVVYTLYGIGDALWIAAWERQELKRGDRLVVCAGGPANPVGSPVSAFTACQNLAFIDEVRPLGCDYGAYNIKWLRPRLGPGWEKAMGWQAPKGPIRMSPDDLVVKSAPVELPREYLCVQPTTTFHYEWRLEVPYTEKDLPVVLVGSEGDRACWKWDGAAFDLRGKLTFEESMWVVANSTRMEGVASWGPMLAGMCGIPTTMHIPLGHAPLQADHIWRTGMPSMEVRWY